MSMMDTNGPENTTPDDGDTASLASYYDNADSARTSSSFEDESESDHEPDDHEADIDKMLMDLEGFQAVRYPFVYYHFVTKIFISL